MDLSLSGRHAVVCGSTQGIGRAAAREIAALGASVTLVARDPARLEAVARELPAPAGQSHDWIAADFADPDALDRRIRRLDRTAHVLVNNTGGPPAGPILDARPAEFVEAFTRHLICNHVLMQALVGGMKQEGYGRIINIVSSSVRQPIKGLGVSNTVRAAVASWAKTLAGELGPFGITVNCILPGYTSTGRLESLIEAMASRRGVDAATVSREMVAEVPAGRFGSPEELGAAVAFLASPAASYINGVALAVDGGRLLCL